VIFDMDGTLTIPVLNFNEMRARLGLPQGTDILAAVANMGAEERERAMEIIEECEEEGFRQLQLQPGILELLHMLAQSQIERAIITRNSKTATQVFLHQLHQQLADNKHRYPLLEPTNTFSEILTRDFEPCKPDPAAVFHICRQWGLEPADVAFVGDGVHDMKCCQNAGAAVGILLRNPQSPQQEKLSDYTVDSLHDIISLFKSCLTVYRH
jgi:HAD superfamily hydrolase (TIGR01549 family)